MSDYNVRLGETDWRALADDLAAFITKYPIPPRSARLHPEWLADRDAVLARYQEARQR